MNSLIEFLNLWGTRCLHSALPMLLQASLLIIVLFLLDLALERYARAGVRYGLWLLVLVKLVLPPSLALPTGIGYWLDTRKQRSVEQTMPATTVLRFSEAIDVEGQSKFSPPHAVPALGLAAFGLLAWIGGSLILFGILVCRSRNIARRVAEAADAPAQLQELLNSCCRQMGIRQKTTLKLAGFAMSPAACGLLRPVILVPEELVNKLSIVSLRAVLLHELGHIKRGDLWVNYFQTLLQIVYWYHPLLWLANAQIRRVREQAVDEMVMVEMGEDAETYPATLLEVARSCFARAKLSLGLVGIVESGSALAQRLKRLVNRPIPKTSRLTMANVLLCLLAGAALLPMAHGQRNDKKLSSDSMTTKAAAPADRTASKSVLPLIVTTTKDGRFYLGTQPVSFDKLRQELEAAVDRDRRAVLSVRAGREVPLEMIVKVMDAARAANIQSVSVITNPEPKVVTVDAKFLALSATTFRTIDLGAPDSTDRNGISTWSLSPEQLSAFLRRAQKLQILGAPKITTTDGQEAAAYIGQVTDGEPSGGSEQSEEIGPTFSVNAIGYVNVNSTNGEVLPVSNINLIGPALRVLPRVADSAIDVVVNAQVTQAVLQGEHGNRRATSAAYPEIRTNFFAEARVLIPNRGTVVIADRNFKDAKGMSVLLLLSTTLSETDSWNVSSPK